MGITLWRQLEGQFQNFAQQILRKKIDSKLNKYHSHSNWWFTTDPKVPEDSKVHGRGLLSSGYSLSWDAPIRSPHQCLSKGSSTKWITLPSSEKQKTILLYTSGTITKPKVRPNKIMLMPYIHLKKMKYEATEEPK